MKLRPYQEKLIQQVQEEWQRGARNVLMQSATGSGKTMTFCHILKHEAGASVAIAHRSELVTQMSLTLARYGVRHRVIGPPAVARQCAALHLAEIGRDYTDSRSKTAVAGVDTLIRMSDSDPWFKQVGLVVQDECFAAGTLIDGKPIETIRVGDMVDAYDEATGRIEKRQVVRLFKNVAPKDMMLVKVGHHVLNCTKGHPFYTRRGWVEAGDLNLNDEVLIYEMYPLRHSDRERDRKSEVQIQDERQNILHSKVRLQSQNSDNETTGAEIASHSEMSRVRECCGLIETPPCSVEKDGACILQSRMFDSISSEDIVTNRNENQQEVRFRTHESQEPDARLIDTNESVCNSEDDGSQTNRSRGQRETSNSTRSDTDDSVWGLGVCGAVPNQDGAKTRFGLPDMLQAGCSESETEIGPRSGRGKSLRAQAHRRKEGQLLTWARVDSVEVYQRGDRTRNGESCDDGYVYNIEVEGLHTYIANGVIVHNCHHVLRENKWGQAASMFPNARGLYPTATPCRSDKKGLGRHADGLIDAMVLGPSMRWLIENGFLTDYRVFAPKSDIDISKVAISQSTGDFNLTQLRSAVHESRQIVGDVVKHYLRIAPGKLGATFCVDVEEATKVAAAYRAAGVPAEVITGNTPPLLRAELMRRFRNRDILQLVSVDILGEGVDVPAIEVVTMARHTASFGLFTQQFGRALRPMEGKSHAIIIDHVGNFVRHGPPDAPQNWTLDRGERRRSSATDAESVRVCDNIDCLAAYPRRLTHCPYCEQPPTVAGRSAPEYVDGDLHELDASVLAHLRGEIERIDGAATLPLHLDAKIQRAVFNRHAEKQEAQRALRQTMALWGGYWVTQGETVRVAQKRFYLTWGIDVMTAQTLGVKDATALRERIVTWLNEQGVKGE